MKHFLLALFALTATFAVQAQDTDIRAKVLDNLELARGHYYINPNEAGPQTKAPKGYKPFYISHFARHGARYCWEDIYTRLDTTLLKAHNDGQLTAEGEAVWSALHAHMPELGYHTGELTSKGWAQHQRAARNMCELFPGVFKRGAEIVATSSNSERCAVSMAGYCTELARNCPDIPLYAYISRTDFDCVIPTSSDNPANMQISTTRRALSQSYSVGPDARTVLRQYFKDMDYVQQLYGCSKMLSDLYAYWCCLQCADEDIAMKNPFTPEEELNNWLQGNYGSFNNYYTKRYQSWPVLADIVEKADKRIAAGSTGADLRFSHDTHFGPLLVLLNAGGNGTVPESPEEVCQYFQDYNVCMATNFHFVFYRSAKNPEILFKLLLNSCETTLPLESVEGPYYRWSDFKDFVAQLGTEARALARNPDALTR